MLQAGMKYAAKSAPLNELIRQFVAIAASLFPLVPIEGCGLGPT
jgi:hypothetical protein